MEIARKVFGNVKKSRNDLKWDYDIHLMERNIHKIYDSQIAMVNSPICNEDDNQDIKTIQEADMEAKRRLREEFSHDTLKKMGNDDFGVSEIIGEAQINAIDFTGAKLQAITWEDINEAM